MTFEWTPGIIETIHRLQAEGNTASQIAVAIGAPSRNAVLGKIFRIRHPQKISPRIEPRKPVPRRPRATKIAAPVIRMPFLEAADGRCRWPLWDDARDAPIATLFYCGEPTGGPSYCPHHADRCFGIGSRGERWAHRVKVAA